MNIKWEFTYTCPTCKDEIGANGVCHVCAPRPTPVVADKGLSCEGSGVVITANSRERCPSCKGCGTCR